MQWVYTHGGVFPVRRGYADDDAFITAHSVLADNGCIAMYCEGGRSRTGVLSSRARRGIGRLALLSGAPVVPVALLNTDEIQPTGKLIPKVKRVRMRFGKPLDFSRYAAGKGDRFVERAVTDEIMYELMALTGRQYIDVYASTLKTAVVLPGTPAGDRSRTAPAVPDRG
jgi:1-acyl-sn-glycerol-3-phosphate acyltransferase